MTKSQQKQIEKYQTKLISRKQLSEKGFEIELSRPADFNFQAGQKLRFFHKNAEKDYSLISSPEESSLKLCIRHVKNGLFSPILAKAEIGEQFIFSGPFGYFFFRHSGRQAVFVATGTGIAPFVSMARSGIRGFTLLHGVRHSDDLYYKSLFQDVAASYIPCISDNSKKISDPADIFYGRVTDYLKEHFLPGNYDFYLCGRGEMIRDITFIADKYFPASLVYTEIFY